MKNMTNRAIFDKAVRTLEASGFVRGDSYVSKYDKGVIFTGKLNGKKTEIKLNFKLAKQIVTI